MTRLPSYEVNELEVFNVQVEDSAPIFAPSIAWALAQTLRKDMVACLSLDVFPRRGPIKVASSELGAHEIHFVVDETTHVAFFRAVLYAKGTAKLAFMSRVASAYPGLVFREGIENGLAKFSLSISDSGFRKKLIHHLAVLNDHGRKIFDEEKENDQRMKRFENLGVRASPESPQGHRDKAAVERRTFPFGGQSLIFEWHTKLFPQKDRIYFHDGIPESSHRIIIGAFSKHL